MAGSIIVLLKMYFAILRIIADDAERVNVMGLYLESGYLNTEWIQKQADKNKISFVLCIGGRQVGKTYGTLQLMLKEKKNFILLRRTITEMEFICSDINSPFTKLDNTIKVKKEGKYTGAITKPDNDGNMNTIGSVMALSCVAKIRGFDGSVYSDLVFDEFIPENHIMKIKEEGDAFLNALVTISGNRELEGQKPLRVWLLANANNIDSPVLAALNIQNKIDEMLIKGQEYSILSDRGIMIILPTSARIMEKRKKTALIRAIQGESRFTEMAFDNKFSYNDDSNIRNVNIKEYKPVFTLQGQFTFYKHKQRGLCYVTQYKSGSCPVYMDSEKDRALVRSRYPDLKSRYIHGAIYFSDLIVKTRFIDLLY